MGTFFRAFSVVFLAAVLVSAYNFFSLQGVAETQARAAVCATRGPKCAPVLMRLFRTPLWDDVRLRLGGQTIEVRCGRTAYLVGEYRCAVR
jgi:hypothetical protein